MRDGEKMASKQIALVTGAAGGIGSAIARKLSSDGFIVLCVDRLADEVNAVASGIPGAHAYACDITSISEIEALHTQLVAAELIPTHIVNSAGVFFTHKLLELEDDQYDLIMNVNVKAIFNLAKTFIPHFIAANYGNIINISSTAGLRGGRERAIYSASKAAVISLSRSLSVDFGKYGIRVNTICPGLIDTPMADWITSKPDQLEAWAKTLSAGRIGTAEDIAHGVSFLASENSSYMYGSTIVIDGGGTA